ncbi:EAL domain-containing protein [Brevibacillus fulvus]|uniref:EAL domain-containing protein (Putative c-di-GMP-specific phosphodiesterase class I) n=1 Tax=Brevibacillus fulvus TaxID=1125967 RepID=A0A938Y2D1_9BACL|nr:EAL domain-containing protein [Brevibacillus fulvus]MBM7592031.1 EAL domain-containing protein (putative c-di-GMP-specific phosphodiesterase class I) [Brevibacillus fulvus]
MYQKPHKGWEKIRTWLYFFYPGRLLKIFPPHFIVRDVVLEQVEKEFKSGSNCLLLLLDLEQYTDIKALYPPDVLLQVENSIADAFRQLSQRFFSAEELLAVQKYGDDDYVLILKETERGPEFQHRCYSFREALEEEIQKKTASFFDYPIRFHLAASDLKKDEGEAQETLLSAYFDARAIAGKYSPSHYSRIRSQVKQIIEEEKIHVLAQPIFSLSSGDVLGWEILTRGPKDTPYYNPMELFDYAHQSRMLMKLELLVMKKAFLAIDQHKTDKPVFINVTVPSLNNPHFLEGVKQLLAKFPQVNPRQVILEITERHVIEEYSTFQQVVDLFRQLGFRFAVDDTGAGYSSLHMITELMPDVIKVDRSIIQQIDRHEVKEAVLQALLAVANKIGSDVIAEGIETAAEARALQQKNVGYAQGYYFSPPHEPFLLPVDNRPLS